MFSVISVISVIFVIFNSTYGFVTYLNQLKGLSISCDRNDFTTFYYIFSLVKRVLSSEFLLLTNHLLDCILNFLCLTCFLHVQNDGLRYPNHEFLVYLLRDCYHTKGWWDCMRGYNKLIKYDVVFAVRFAPIYWL